MTADIVVFPNSFRPVSLGQITGVPHEPTLKLNIQELIHSFQESDRFCQFRTSKWDADKISWQWTYNKKDDTFNVTGIVFTLFSSRERESVAKDLK